MLMYIIGPWTFQMICLGLIFETLGVKYDCITSTRNENEDKQRQKAS